MWFHHETGDLKMKTFDTLIKEINLKIFFKLFFHQQDEFKHADLKHPII